MKEVFTPIDFSNVREKKDDGSAGLVRVWMYQTVNKKWHPLSVEQSESIDKGFKAFEGMMVDGECKKNIGLDNEEKLCIKKTTNGDLSATYITKNNEYLEVGFYVVCWAWEEPPTLVDGILTTGPWHDYSYNFAKLCERLLSEGINSFIDNLYEDTKIKIDLKERIMTHIETGQKYRMRRLSEAYLDQKYRESDKELHRIYGDECKHKDMEIDGVALDTYINNTISRDPNMRGYEGLGGFGFKRVAIDSEIYRNFIAKKNEYENGEEHTTILGFIADKSGDVDKLFENSKYITNLVGASEQRLCVSLSPSFGHRFSDVGRIKKIKASSGAVSPESIPFQVVPVLLTFKGVPVANNIKIPVESENSTVKVDCIKNPVFYTISEGCTCAAILPLGICDYYKEDNNYYQQLRDKLSCETMVETVCKAPKLHNLFQEHANGTRLQLLNVIMSFIEPSTKSDHLYLPSDSLIKRAEEIEERCIHELSNCGMFSPNKTSEETQGSDSESPQKHARLG